MLGLIVAFFIGRSFYKLAKKNGKNAWLFAISGAAVYYGMSIIGAAIIDYLVVTSGNNLPGKAQFFVLEILGASIGLVFVWFFDFILRRSWEGRSKQYNPEILDSTDF